MPKPKDTPNLTDAQRRQIIGLRHAKTNFRKIEAIVGCSKETAKSVFYQWRRDSTISTHRTGAPPIISKLDKRRLVRATQNNRKQPLQDITYLIAPHASIRTVQPFLGQTHIKKWIAADRQELKKDFACRQFKWALKYKDWTAEDWKRVIWSDKCKSQINPHRMRLGKVQESASNLDLQNPGWKVA